MSNIYLRNIEITDLDNYYNWNLPDSAFHKFNAPYFPKMSASQLQQQIEQLKVDLLNGSLGIFTNKKIIADVNTNEIIGEVSWYWKSKETNWIEIGIVIFNQNYWNIGIGKKALILWVTEIFNNNAALVRIGFSTWSGNIAMIKLGEALNFKKEATYRKARIVDGKYYDAVSYGILREEWFS